MFGRCRYTGLDKEFVVGRYQTESIFRWGAQPETVPNDLITGRHNIEINKFNSCVPTIYSSHKAVEPMSP